MSSLPWAPRRKMPDTPLPSTMGSLELREGVQDASRRVYALQVIGASGVSTLTLAPGQKLRVGRRRDSDVVIEHAAASRDHATIYGGDPPEVEDLGSNNGTRVQGNRIAPRMRVPVPMGSVIEIAGTVLHVRQATPSTGDLASGGARAWSADAAGEKRRRIVVEDRKMSELYELADRAAKSSMAILILGETGVGKEVIAERIHASSPRRERPLLRVNCAALTEGVLASELFGHERGAFTGAHATKIGIFEAANGGTVFLDEIGELSMETQAKLLRVLETGELTRVGSHQPRQVDVRVVSATNRDLGEQIARGKFRSDLFFRLNGISLAIPPLRARRADILPLAEFFAERCAALMGMAAPVFSDQAKAALLGFRWPGNVRELKNVVERAVVLTQGSVLDPSALALERGHTFTSPTLPPPASSAPQSSGPSESVRGEALHPASAREGHRAADSRAFDTENRGGPRTARSAGRLKSGRRTEQLRAELVRAERDRIIEALEQAGSQAGAAKLLGLSRRALIYRLELYDIPRPRKGSKPPEG
jgi:two-component system response regulator AtoC